MRMDTQNGVIRIANHVVASVAGAAAASCFGVRGLASRSAQDTLYHLLRGEKQTQGVTVRSGEGDCVELDLRVALDSGVNIRTTCRNLQHQVRYKVQQSCGIHVGKIQVFVETVKA